MTDSQTQAIGIFDSGVGGLTVLNAVKRSLPHESLLYLGDTARVPYGTKSGTVVRTYAERCATFLRRENAKAIVIACNTASAVAVDSLASQFQVPVIGVILPGVQEAVNHTRSGRIGVIGTEGTVKSQAYQKALKAADASLKVFMQPCPLFVPLAEEGMQEHPATEMLAREYLEPLVKANIDTLVLGCTHYPLLTPTLKRILPREMTIINSAQAVATALAARLRTESLLQSDPALEPSLRVFTTDANPRFQRIGESFFGEALGNIEHMDL